MSLTTQRKFDETNHRATRCDKVVAIAIDNDAPQQCAKPYLF